MVIWTRATVVNMLRSVHLNFEGRAKRMQRVQNLAILDHTFLEGMDK